MCKENEEIKATEQEKCCCHEHHEHDHEHHHEHHHHDHGHDHEHHHHDHDHDHEHHHHDHDHSHEHSHCGCGCEDHGEEKKETKDMVLLHYMIDHNEHHAQEIEEMAETLRAQGNAAAADEIMEAVTLFDEGNAHLAKAYALLK